MTWCVPAMESENRDDFPSIKRGSPDRLHPQISVRLVLMNQCLFAYVFSLDVVCLWQSYGSDPYIKQRVVKWLGHQ